MGVLAAVAVRHLARRPPRLTVAVVGAGALARAILAAVLEVIRPDRVLIASRRPESRRALVEGTSPPREVLVSAAESVSEAVAAADIVVTATTARAPVLASEWIRAGALVYLVGAGFEADSRVYRRAAKIVVSDWQEWLTREDVAGMAARGELSEGDLYTERQESCRGRRGGATATTRSSWCGRRGQSSTTSRWPTTSTSRLSRRGGAAS